jgi:hypothetical protein
MPALALPLTFALAGTLAFAGLAKLLPHNGLAGTLAALGVPGPLRTGLRVAVPAGELLVAVGLLLRPGQWWVWSVVLALAAGFAVAGLLGVRAHEPVACACFGLTGSGVLGWRQVLALPGWILAVGLLAWAEPSWSTADGLTYLAALALGLVAIRAAPVLVAWRAAAADRDAVSQSTEQPQPILVPREVDI